MRRRRAASRAGSITPLRAVISFEAGGAGLVDWRDELLESVDLRGWFWDALCG